MPDVARASERLRGWLRDQGLSVNAFARENGLTQSTVQRLVAGRSKRMTPTIRRILNYASIEAGSGITHQVPPAHQLRLLRAVEAHWAGHLPTLEAIVSVIEAVAPTLVELTKPNGEHGATPTADR